MYRLKIYTENINGLDVKADLTSVSSNECIELILYYRNYPNYKVVVERQCTNFEPIQWLPIDEKHMNYLANSYLESISKLPIVLFDVEEDSGLSVLG